MKNYRIPLLLLGILALTACNLPRPTATGEDPGLIHTIAAMTVEAQLTLDAAIEQPGDPGNQQPEPGQPEAPTATLTSTNTPLPTNTPAPVWTNTPVPTATKTPIPCDHITWGKDITIPDGTELVPGETFTKTWRLNNTGSCTWTSGYSLVFDSGDRMGAPDDLKLTSDTVAPGQEYDVSVVLTAPDEPGDYRGNFKLRNPSGAIFGLGKISDPFYVDINIPDRTGVMFDFLAVADEGDWGTGTGDVDFATPGDTDIDYGGPDTDANGFAMVKDDQKLEDGGTSGVILETHPKWVDNGYVVGRFPPYKVGAGDYIKGRLGFIAFDDGSCGVGDADFQIYYTLGDDIGSLTKLGEWNETCDGDLTKINIGLSTIKGKTVRFYLVVSANGVSTQDWTIWSSLGVWR
jgi:hypothetical protein